LVLAFAYFGVYRPLASFPEQETLRDVIAMARSIRLPELEILVSNEMSSRMSRSLTPSEQRKLRRERRRAISLRMAPVEFDAGLFLAFTRRKAVKLRKEDPGTYTESDWLIQEAFERARSCCLLLAFAKAVRALLPWDARRWIVFHRETILVEVRELLLVFLRLTETYGAHHRENLLAVLDVWELAEEAL
jgi:hypothetical protein